MILILIFSLVFCTLSYIDFIKYIANYRLLKQVNKDNP